MSARQDYLIRKRRSPYGWLGYLLLLAVSAWGGWFFCSKGESVLLKEAINYHEQFRSMSESYQLLQEENTWLKEANEGARESLAEFEEARKLDRQATIALKEDIKDLQDTVFRIKGELQFYESLLDSAHQFSGLRVQGLYVHSASGPNANRYRYKVVLMHLAKQGKPISGRMKMVVKGVANGDSQSLALRKLVAGDVPDFSFNFKHFKVFEGYLELPENFLPREALVMLESADGKRKLAEETFNWPETT